jgi:hypothetical protein
VDIDLRTEVIVSMMLSISITCHAPIPLHSQLLTIPDNSPRRLQTGIIGGRITDDCYVVFQGSVRKAPKLIDQVPCYWTTARAISRFTELNRTPRRLQFVMISDLIVGGCTVAFPGQCAEGASLGMEAATPSVTHFSSHLQLLATYTTLRVTARHGTTTASLTGPTEGAQR